MDEVINEAPEWLKDEPTTFDEAKKTVLRLQRTILVLVAAGFITFDKADQAFEIACGAPR